MKRFLSVLAAVLLAQTATFTLYAQDEEPSIRSVLDAARAKYWAEKAQTEAQTNPESAEDAESPSSRIPDFPYTPIIVSFVPGVSFPFGIYDTSLAAGAIGNITRDVAGIEGAGIFNIARMVRGAQGAGVFNIVEGIEGAQGAGVFNISGNAGRAVQGAGVFNIASGEMKGVQGAGVFNIAENIGGIQGAGVFNIAAKVAGVQAAGVFNSADSVVGAQIGIVNVAKRVQGIQLGLVNIAGNGVDSLGVEYEPDTGFAGAYWQAGTPACFTVAEIRAPYRNWAYDLQGAVGGLGLGSRGHMLGIAIDTVVYIEQPLGHLPYDSFDWKGDWRDWQGWSELRPYPAFKIAASLPIGFHWRITGGLKADIDLRSLGERVPDALKAGDAWRFSCFGQDFSVWPKWFFGIAI